MFFSVHSYLVNFILNCFLLRHYSWRNFKRKCQWKKSLTTFLCCSFLRNLCMLKSSLQAKLWAITLMLNQAAPLIATKPTDLLLRKSALKVKKLSVLMCEVSPWQCDSEGTGSRHCKDRVTANRPQTSLDKRHLSNHTIPLDTFVLLELLQSAAALQPRLISLRREAINPRDKRRLNTQTQNSHNLTVLT